MKAKVFAFLALTATTTTLLIAGVVPGRWEKVEILSPGEPLTVILKTGDRIEGAFVGIECEVLRIDGYAGRDTKIPKQEVDRVEFTVNDGVSNGALWGAVIGFAGPAIVTFASGVDKTEYPLGLGIGVIGAAAGGLIGWQTDKSRAKTEVLYHASP
jgi:hypothetical protein